MKLGLLPFQNLKSPKSRIPSKPSQILTYLLKNKYLDREKLILSHSPLFSSPRSSSKQIVKHFFSPSICTFNTNKRIKV